MKGQLISDWKVTRYEVKVWCRKLINMPVTKRFYGRLRRSEGTFVEVELE